MQALGDHLGADENIDAAFFEGPEGFPVSLLAGHRISVHAGDPSFWENPLERLLDLLSSRAGVADFRVGAFWAGFRGALVVTANVADQTLGGAVVSEGDTTIAALANMAAGFADHGGRKSSPIEKQNRLFAFLDTTLDGIAERF
jgi:hypothetical protein